MPYHLGRWSRRDVIRGSLGMGVGMLLPGCASYPVFRGLPVAKSGEATQVQPWERWALIADPHISEDPDAAFGAVNMAAHLQIAVSGVLERSKALPAPMAGVIVNGDCAFEFGRPGDYATFTQLLVEPLKGADIPMHLTLGNHDHRRHLLDALSEYAHPMAGDGRAVDGRLVSIVPGRYANFYLLDTLDERYILAGGVGGQQIDWLAAALERHSDLPAIVIGHHPLEPECDLLGHNTSLLDAKPLWNVLTRYRHVKAYVFGHTHRWDVKVRDGIYLVNLPSTAYTFDAGQPQGWVELWVGSDRARLELRHIVGRTISPAAADSAELRWA
jgi:3',5'-cyclic AMP phosphodiesterase CpdA